MRHTRKVVASTVVLLAFAASGTVHADDGTDDTTPTTIEAPPPTTQAPKVTITVADVPVETDPPATNDMPEPSVLPEPKPTPSTDAPSTTDDAPPSSESSTTSTTSDTPPTLAASTEVSVGPTTTLNPNQNNSDQQALVNGTQVANGNTGGNLTSNDQANGTAVPGADISSGDATAIGSDDTNSVTQGADVVLTDQALANVLQVALILNIGAALANSGANGVNSAPGGSGSAGDIGTGNADATGLSMAQYITQAANAEGDANTDDAAKQLAVSLWMGIGMANSGTNAITGDGGTGSGGAIGSGDATAIGNRSLTDILQGAAVNGSGTSQTDIQQYATVMNLGFALANSGANDIAGVASNLLTAGSSDEQNAMATDLFSMLLPALLSTYATSAGSGSIGTGNATAIGNDSQTYVKQLAMAANSGDGIASIIQNVLVANAGAAGANTGVNQLGGSFASLSPDAAKAVVTLAAFLAQMLAMVHYQATDQAKVAQEQGLDIPFGDIVLQVRGAMQGVDTTLGDTSGTGTGPTAHVRQVTIVLSLGWAMANAGLNAAIDQNPGAAALMSSNDFAAGVNDATVDRIRTANAAGINQGLVVICQRRNADDIACLAPPPPDDPPADDPGDDPTTVPPVQGDPVQPPRIITQTPDILWQDPVKQPTTPSGFLLRPVPQQTTTVTSLPATGTDMQDSMQVAAWFLGGGTAFVVLARRRRRKSS